MDPSTCDLFILGLEALSNLEVLDVSMNCISDYPSCYHLACFDKLVSVSVFSVFVYQCRVFSHHKVLYGYLVYVKVIAFSQVLFRVLQTGESTQFNCFFISPTLQQI